MAATTTKAARRTPFVVQVDDVELHRHVELYVPLPLLLRLDVLPFLMLYCTFSLCSMQADGEGRGFIVAMAIVFFAHALAFFSSEWSVDIKTWNAYAKFSMDLDALHSCTFPPGVVVKIDPVSSTLPKELCPLHWNSDAHESDAKMAIPRVWFSYQKLRFCVYATAHDNEASKVVFQRLNYPTTHGLQQYTSSSGYQSMQNVNVALARWQENEFDIPIPEFWELLKQHLVAPFFVFQFFCMLLWCLDEYMYYSLLTLAMLILFECTLVKQRQHNMGLLRQMRRPPVRMFVYRMKKWTEITSRSLLPGDICSIGRSKPIYRGQDMSESVVPCDLLLLHGGCVVNEAMLSGESIPLRKEALDVAQYDACAKLNMDENSMSMKKHILYGGTKVLQFTNNTPAAGAAPPSIPDPPDKGCIAFVLRTGFGTTQGNLMRTILFSAPRVTANNKESMLFILFLLCFAVVASGIVLQQGLNDPTRNTFKLFLHCVMIITSVVPPELPMELSLAVTNSLVSLTKLSIFCTEPFRIPFAGKVDVICFDKTGTLTSDALEMHGVAGLNSTALVALDDPLQLVAPTALPTPVQLILAGCHSLMVIDGKVLGDPLETTIMAHIQWNVRPGDVMVPHLSFLPGPKSMKIVHRYAFSSDLKRMSSIVVVESPTETDAVGVSLLSKGAPEVMESLFKTIPDFYTKVYKHYAVKGCRVLALGSKSLSTRDLQRLKSTARSEMEQGLDFGGFLVLDCPLKPDTADVIHELKKSNHSVVMITGDNALTACDVATQIQLASHRKTWILEPSPTHKSLLEWVDPHHDDEAAVSEQSRMAFTPDEETMASLAASATLCVTGSALSLLPPAQLEVVARHARVFARTSPSQKEAIVDALNQGGFVTAMCGDGTNDVGALKRAHVGISIINNPDQSTNLSRDNTHPTTHVVKFGDASIASPFTSKQPSIRATCQILCQGRCTLVTTLQMYKILGINCLISAYVLSSLYIYGVKQGDTQMTVVGVVIALFFLFLSYAKPRSRLSAHRPLARVFCLSVLLSMAIQFGVHLATLVAALRVALPFVDLDDPAMHPEAKFRPNVLNSIVFLVSLHMQVNTFVVNYHGAPFMQSFRDNRYLARWTYLAYALVFVALWEIFPPINDMLELVFLPSFETQAALTVILVLDTVAVLGLEAVVQHLTVKYPALMA